MILKWLYLALLLTALAVCLFLFWAYSNLLDFFPWGNNRSYVIWEPLVVYFILPAFFTVGLIVVVTSGKSAPRSNLLFLTVAALLSLPTLIGFDLETDNDGRWAGVLTAIISASFIIYVMYLQILKLTRKRP